MIKGFYFFVKFALVRIYILKVEKIIFDFIEKKYVQFFPRIFSLEKHVPSHVLNDFSDKELETTPRSIYLELLIIEIVF